jgi:transposase InsO family protein
MIKPIFKQSRQTYGSPRVCAALRAQGQRCGKNRIARLMRQSGLHAKQKCRFRPPTTLSKHNLPLSQNWLAKVPSPERPNQVWVADITYIPTAEGWLYLAALLDACSRKIVGWSHAQGSLHGLGFGSLAHGHESLPAPSGPPPLFRSREPVCQ